MRFQKPKGKPRRVGPRIGNLLYSSTLALLILIGISAIKPRLALARTCDDLFADPLGTAISKTLTADSLYRGIQQLYAKQGTRTVIAYDYLKPRGLDSVFLSPRSLVILRGDYDLAGLYLSFHHESGHSTTLHRLKTNPEDPENALAIAIFREGMAIDPSLSMAYREGYQTDEMKTHLRSSNLSAQIQRALSAAEDKVNIDPHFKILSESYRLQSETFARVTMRILAELESNLTVSNGSFPFQYWIEPYSRGVNDIYRVTVTLPQLKGSPVLVHLPVYAPDKTALRMPALRQKLIELCRNGQKIARRYLP